jgi:flavonol-3-O-L-rhamnoside-7-O-glucosyltransferase
MDEVTQCPKPRFLVIPWPATSHMIPIVDIGCLVAADGAPVTIITTPSISQLVQSRVDVRAGQAGSADITVTALPFPAMEAGLPDGCEPWAVPEGCQGVAASGLKNRGPMLNLSIYTTF